MVEDSDYFSKELPRSDTRFWRGLFDIHLDPLAFIDTRYRIVRANRALAAALGRQPSDLIGMVCHEIFHQTGGPVCECPHQKLMQDGCPHASEMPIGRLGGIYWISVTPVFDNIGNLLGCLHIARNVTAYKRAETALRLARDREEARAAERAEEIRAHLRFERSLVSFAQAIGQAISDADFLFAIRMALRAIRENEAYDRCAFWKRTAGCARLLAWDAVEDAEGRLPPLPGEATPETIAWLFEESPTPTGKIAVATLAPLWPGDPAFVLHAERRALEPAAETDARQERLQLVCGIVGDALRRQSAAFEAQRLRDELAHFDRMARLGQLSGLLAHELNQPLAATVCNAQAAVRLLDQKQVDLGEVRSALEDIVSSARHAGEVMRHTRALFKGGREKGQPLDLGVVVSDVLRLMRDEIAESGVAMDGAEVFADLPRINGVRVQLQQVFCNLIRNALDAVKSRPPETRTLRVAASRPDEGHVAVSVMDNGIGIAPGNEEEIFEPLHSSKADGMGMGLPICREIMRQHGGEIRAQRMPDGGASFTIFLPVWQELKNKT